MAATFGKIGEFEASKEEWTQYVERMDYFFVANGITDDEKKRAIFLTVIGAAAYKLLRNLIAPDKPGDKAYEDLVEAMKQHHSPIPSEIVQRFKFNSRFRQHGETVSTFVSELRSLAEFCNFGSTLDDMLRDRLVCGINDDHIQRRLLSEEKLTFKRALEVAQALETAAKNAQALQGPGTRAEVHKLSPEGKNQSSTKCYRCGKSNHSPDKCRFRDATCHKCGKVGHIKAVCRSQTGKSNPKLTERSALDERQSVKLLEEPLERPPEEYTLFSLASEQRQKPFEVELLIEGQPLTMEIDTGASLSVISTETYQHLWPDRPLQPSNIKLKTYTGETLQVSGSLEVQVRHGSQEAKLPLLVINGKGPSLLGRDWLARFRLNWHEIHQLHNSALQEILERHQELFKDELGTLKGYKAKIHVEANVKPHFCKARTVPYSMRPLVEKELDRLVQEGVIEPVPFADWAAPIVPVLKSDKASVRICGDFKQTVNQASKLDRHPIPRIEDLFAKLAGGRAFTKLDMSQAYQQLLLEEESKQYVVINTHRGLFKYHRLPFGIASAPGIFQRMMENLLQGIPNVVVYIDDILVTGATEQEHLEALEEVLTRLEKAGLRLKRSKCFFMASTVVFLGHRIDAQGLHPMEEKVKAVQEAPHPRNVQELKSYLGLLSYYNKFLPNLASTLAPLYHLLRASTRWHWSAREEEAFQSSKRLLLSSQVLVHFDPTKELLLSCDASAYGIGAVLSHRMPDGTDRPIGFASRTLTTAEKNYSQIEKEGLACVFGVKKFHTYLYGHSFTLFTDHKPLLSLFHAHRAIPTQASARIQRWALTLSMYEYTVAFKPSTTHGNADALSCLPLPEKPKSTPLPPEMILMMEHLQESPITAEQIRAWTHKDPLLSRVLQFILSRQSTQSVLDEEDRAVNTGRLHLVGKSSGGSPSRQKASSTGATSRASWSQSDEETGPYVSVVAWIRPRN